MAHSKSQQHAHHHGKTNTMPRHSTIVLLTLLAGLSAHCGDDPKPLPEILTFEPFDVDAGTPPTSEPDPAQQTGGAMSNDLMPMGGGEVDAGAKNSGIGTACDTDADCAEGQYCHMDFENYTMHRQCTAVCDSTEFCQEQFGQGTFCIGAEVCVAACITDSDCGASTVCADLGRWCSRQGPDSGNPYCAGSPTPCGLLSGIACSQQSGCIDSSDCSGSSTSCYSLFTSTSCTFQDGCTWDYTRDECSGSSDSCYSMSSEFGCTSQEGCYWSSNCIGTPRESDCGDLSAGLCEFTDGCFVVNP